MEHVREMKREELQGARQEQRAKIGDKYREISSEHSSEIKNEREMFRHSQMLKHKDLITPELLRAINNGLLVSEKMISAFMKEQEPMCVLLRLFSVNRVDARLQLLAAHCLCNIALGEKATCLRMVKMAGTFFVSRMCTMSSLLAEASAWTIGNFSRFRQVVDLLKKQGAYRAADKQLASKYDGVRKAAVYCLTQALLTSCSSFDESELLDIAKRTVVLSPMEPCDLHLLYLTSHSPLAAAFLVQAEAHLMALDFLLVELHKKMQQDDGDYSYLLTLVRLLGNLAGESSGIVAKHLLKSPHMPNVAKSLFQCPQPAVVKETAWFVSNMIRHCREEVQLLSLEVGAILWFPPGTP